jgi:glutamyl-tRNA synthetase
MRSTSYPHANWTFRPRHDTDYPLLEAFMTQRPTVTRFAPSPTGYIHVGNLRTALMNYLIARKTGGTFILRLDDTDQERSKPEYCDGIMADLEWLGLHWDRVERQSLRFDRYREAAEDLKAKDRFYECLT